MPPDAALPDPDAIAGRTFGRARKGLDPDEVRAYLVQIAGETRELLREQDDLRRRLAEVERRAADPRELDEETVTELLGEETAKLLVEARRTAAEIRTRAEEEAAAVRLDAREEATATREEADAYADSKRTLADEADDKIRADAEAYAAGMRDAAESDTARQREEADEYSRTTRETADAEIEAMRAEVRATLDEQLAASESVLAERTAEAEAAAAAIRTEAEEHRSTTVAEADGYAAETRTAADEHAREAAEAAAALRAEAEAAATAQREGADAKAAELVSVAEVEAARAIGAANTEADEIIAAAKARGIEMVEEASEYRERVLADLAARRRTARAQLEQLASIRDSLAVRLTDVRHQIERSHDDLQQERISPEEVGDAGVDREALARPEPEAPAEADSQPAGAGPDDGGPGGADPDELADPAEPDDAAELAGAGPDGGESPDGDALETEAPTFDDGPGQPTAEEPEEPEEPEDDPVREVPVADEASEPVGGADSADGDAPAPEDDGADGDDPDGDVPPESDPDPIPGPEDPAPEEPSNDDHPGDGAPRIDDLFARIRAERDDGTDHEDDAGDFAADDAPADDPEPVDPEPGDDAPAEVSEGHDAPLIDLTPTADVEGEADGGASEDEDEDERSDDEELLELRDATTDELERQLARRLKRVLADEQNELLDLLRRTKGTPDPDVVLPSPDEHLDRYLTAALEDLQAAERAGAGFYGDAPDGSAEVDDLARAFAEDLIRQIRGRLEGSFAVDAGEDEVADAIRAHYREWKTQRIAEIARHHVVVAFSRGVVEAAPAGSAFRWLVDHGGAASPDCDDNALEGAVPRGDEFPTGALHPPVHPGCRCLLVPAGDT